jgi:acyl-CoA thioesterase FadM
VTAELAVRYRRPVPVATEIVVWAVVVEKKKKFLGVKARLEIAGEVHAEADAKIFCLGDKSEEMMLL